MTLPEGTGKEREKLCRKSCCYRHGSFINLVGQCRGFPLGASGGPCVGYWQNWRWNMLMAPHYLLVILPLKCEATCSSGIGRLFPGVIRRAVVTMSPRNDSICLICKGVEHVLRSVYTTPENKMFFFAPALWRKAFFFLFYFFFLVFIQILDRNFCAFSYLCRLQGCLLVVSHLKLLLWKKYVHQCLKETNCYFKEWEYNSLEAFSSSFHIIIKAAIYNEPHHSFFHRKKKKRLWKQLKIKYVGIAWSIFQLYSRSNAVWWYFLLA